MNATSTDSSTTAHECYSTGTDDCALICYLLAPVVHRDGNPHRLSLQDLREWLAEILPLRRIRQAPPRLPGYGRASLRRRTGPANRCYYVKRKRRKNG